MFTLTLKRACFVALTMVASLAYAEEAKTQPVYPKPAQPKGMTQDKQDNKTMDQPGVLDENAYQEEDVDIEEDMSTDESSPATTPKTP